MKLIKQKHDTDCGVAAFAMILNLSYRQALNCLFPKRSWFFKDATTKIIQLENGLRKYGYRPIRSEDSNFQSFTKRAILIVKSKNPTEEIIYHAVVWDQIRQCVLDPANCDFSTQDYVDRFVMAIIIDGD